MSEIAWLVARYLGYAIVLLALNGMLTVLRLGQRKLRYSKEVNGFPRGSLQLSYLALALLFFFTAAQAVAAVRSTVPGVLVPRASWGLSIFTVLVTTVVVFRPLNTQRDYYGQLYDQIGLARHWLDGNVKEKVERIAISVDSLTTFRDASFLTVFQLAMAALLLVLGVSAEPPGSPLEPPVLRGLIAVLAGLVLMIVVLVVANLSAKRMNISLKLVKACLVDDRLRIDADPTDSDLPAPLALLVGRWRTTEHEMAFNAGEQFNRVVQVLRRRLPKPEFEVVARAYAGLADALRVHGLKTKTDGRAVAVFDHYRWALATLATNEDILASAARIRTDLGIEGRDSYSTSRRARVLTASDGFLERHARVIRLGAIAVVIASLAATRQLAPVLDFIRELAR